MSRVIDWIFRPARWWEFWQPQSGIPGGIIGGFSLAVAVVLVCEVFQWLLR
ncbi:MAG: hypothetical protein ACYSW3_29780 [Planctomycetota bacterium]